MNNRLPKSYRLVKGSPDYVEQHVTELLAQGYVLGGDLYTYRIPATNTVIFVQPMVQYENYIEQEAV